MRLGALILEAVAAWAEVPESDLNGGALPCGGKTLQLMDPPFRMETRHTAEDA
jgi:hypothetical protein